ncbi:hybrid sensor histidine kinase/response regulator [Roseimaritima ulvae]|uniref:histidine kinase n=1 Tax=Roseimaritima ulvae TaxID=980254 RepID=A0A5B9QWC6_9BACT|nr:hybrid sensor histidine kinase/response regulator [Roseimaritima ulvae]QEG41685.1 Sensor protein EvgS precursor [Roseimaritima ulvae]
MTSPQRGPKTSPGEREFEELTRITNELVTTQRQLYKQSCELRRLNEEKNIAIGIVAHDLRNPLALMKMQSELLLDQCAGELSTDHQQLLQSISEQGRMMLTIVNDLLDASAIEAGSFHLARETVDVIPLVEHFVQSQALLAAPKSISLRFLPPQGVLLALLDPAKFQQVLTNLIGNAVKFSPAETAVDISLADHGEQFEIRVRDSGPGIPDSQLKSLCEPFQTVGGRSQGGEKNTGLGLTIVRRIIEKHGGSLNVSSEPGVGSVFSVSMPTGQPQLSGEAPSSPPVATFAATDTPPDTAEAPLRVLIVDDYLPAAKMTATMVARVCQADIELASDGAAAVERVTTFEPHLVLLDIELPTVSGREVAKRIREHDTAHPPLVCAVTAHAGEELEKIASLDTFDCVSAKPISLADLQSFVDAAKRRLKSGVISNG